MSRGVLVPRRPLEVVEKGGKCLGRCVYNIIVMVFLVFVYLWVFLYVPPIYICIVFLSHISRNGSLSLTLRLNAKSSGDVAKFLMR